MGYFPEGVVNGGTGFSHPQSSNPMMGVVKTLSVKAKQAMYAASQKGLIARGTWDGCAFNAAGGIIGLGGTVQSYERAAAAFGMAENDVARFIHQWDRLHCSDEQANKYLVEALLDAGLATPVGTGRGKRIIRGYAYKSEATKFQEQLESGELTVAMIPGCEEAAQLLSATC